MLTVFLSVLQNLSYEVEMQQSPILQNFHNISKHFLMLYQIFFSPEVKQWAIITYKHGIYELPHELPNDFRLRILGN